MVEGGDVCAPSAWDGRVAVHVAVNGAGTVSWHVGDGTMLGHDVGSGRNLSRR